MRAIREEERARRAVDAAYSRWAMTDEAWQAVTWALARDPYSAGPALSESGLVRTFVFEGARSISMPTVRVLYVIEPAAVSITVAVFEESVHLYAGRA